MNIFHTIKEYQVWYRQNVTVDCRVALISTKGCLHQGHTTLAQIAKSQCHWSILTISLHPNQFEGEDEYSRFPRVASKDIELARDSGHVDILLLMKSNEYLKYGPDHGVFVWLQSDLLPSDQRHWNHDIAEAEGTMLVKMLNVTRATHIYLGGNDLLRSRMQQRLLTDLLYEELSVVEIPTVRDNQDIAYNARLHYLSELERSTVAIVYKALRAMVQLYLQDVLVSEELMGKALAILQTEDATLQVLFIRIAHPYGFQDIESIDPTIGAIAIAKVQVAGKAIHLDNVILAPRIPAREKRLVALIKNPSPR